MVVDDDAATLRLVARIVSSAGHQVLQANNGREALDTILQTPPDLVVCDWDMPELDGVQLCREVRQQLLTHYVYFLLLTGRSSEGETVEGLAAGADDFVTKPINRGIFLARLEAGSRIVRMERQLRSFSERDSLTGILNRRKFHECLGREWERATRHGRPLSCVMIDLDFFKRINDEHGHASGDLALQAVARLLCDQGRSSDILCRYGGEEFCVLVPETDELGAVRWAERVRDVISETPLAVGDLTLPITASFGVAERLADTAGPEQLVELADQALAVAKYSGRNRVVRFGTLKEPMLNPSDRQAAADPLGGVLARDVMAVALVCPNQNDTVRYVADLFLQSRVDSAPVVDDTGVVTGIVSEADLLARTSLGQGWDDQVGEVMRTNAVCYEEDTPIEQVYEFLSRVSIPRIVVVDQGRPSGVISRATLLCWFRNWVATQERGGSDARQAHEADERDRRKAGVIRTSAATAQRANDLCRRIMEEDGDFVPRVVGEATRLQSLAGDLLGYCRSGNVP